MSTMINDLKKPYYYCLQTYHYGAGTTFHIGWEYQKNYVDKFWNIDKTNFKLIE